MTGYLANFAIYTLAMVGIIFAALFIFKFVSSGRGFSKKSTFLAVEDSMSLSARKTVYVIKAGGERFLVAADIDRTSLIAKLGEKDSPAKVSREDKSLDLNSLYGPDCMEEFSKVEDFASLIDFPQNKTEKTDKGPMMRELAKKLSAM